MANLDELPKDLFGSKSAGIKVAGELRGTLADFSGALGFVQLTINFVTSAVKQRSTELKDCVDGFVRDRIIIET